MSGAGSQVGTCSLASFPEKVFPDSSSAALHCWAEGQGKHIPGLEVGGLTGKGHKVPSAISIYTLAQEVVPQV